MIQINPTAEHPLPFDMSDEQPKTHADSIAIAVNTADFINQLGGSIDYNNTDLQKAKELVLGENKPNVPKHISVPAEAAAASAIIKRFDFQAFSDQLQARNFITNKLVQIADCGDTRHELKALELLGKISDVGLFTERSEITVHHTSSQSLEDSIRDRVKRLMNAEVTDITPLDDLDAQLGTPGDYEAGFGEEFQEYIDPQEKYQEDQEEPPEEEPPEEEPPEEEPPEEELPNE